MGFSCLEQCLFLLCFFFSRGNVTSSHPPTVPSFPLVTPIPAIIVHVITNIKAKKQTGLLAIQRQHEASFFPPYYSSSAYHSFSSSPVYFHSHCFKPVIEFVVYRLLSPSLIDASPTPKMANVNPFFYFYIFLFGARCLWLIVVLMAKRVKTDDSWLVSKQQ